MHSSTPCNAQQALACIALSLHKFPAQSELATSLHGLATWLAPSCSILQLTGLQNQVSILLVNQHAADEGRGRLAALEGVISRLQSTVLHVGSIAGKAASDNKALLVENQHLAAERKQLLDNVQQFKVSSGMGSRRLCMCA